MSNLSATRSSGGYDLLAVLPPAALGRALGALKSGEWLLAAGLMVWGAVGIVLALYVWRWALARRLDGAGGGGKTKEAAVPVGTSVLFPAWVRWLPRTPMGATAAKEMHYYLFRSTLQLQQLVLGTVFALLFAGRSLFGSDPGPMADYLGALVLFVVLFQIPRQRACGIDAHGHVDQLVPDDLMFHQRLAEGFSLARPAQRFLVA